MTHYIPDPDNQDAAVARLRCHFCGRTATRDEAGDGGWTPDFWFPDGTCGTDPACPDCTARHLRCGADGEHELRRAAPRKETMVSTYRPVETWAGRSSRLRRPHRLYLTVWGEGDPDADAWAARREADIAHAACCLEVSWGDMLAVIERG